MVAYIPELAHISEVVSMEDFRETDNSYESHYLSKLQNITACNASTSNSKALSPDIMKSEKYCEVSITVPSEQTSILKYTKLEQDHHHIPHHETFPINEKSYTTTTISIHKNETPEDILSKIIVCCPKNNIDHKYILSINFKINHDCVDPHKGQEHPVGGSIIYDIAIDDKVNCIKHDTADHHNTYFLPEQYSDDQARHHYNDVSQYTLYSDNTYHNGGGEDYYTENIALDSTDIL